VQAHFLAGRQLASFFDHAAHFGTKKIEA